MKKTSFCLLMISTVLIFSCGNDDNNKTKEIEKVNTNTNKFIHPNPGLEIDNGLTTSPTETPVNITQQHKYKTDKGETIVLSFSFDDNGNSLVTIIHPSHGELKAVQDGDAASNNVTYKGDKGVEINVTNKTATLQLANITTQYTLIN